MSNNGKLFIALFIPDNCRVFIGILDNIRENHMSNLNKLLKNQCEKRLQKGIDTNLLPINEHQFQVKVDTDIENIWKRFNKIISNHFGTTVQNPLGGSGIIPFISNTSTNAYDETTQCLPTLRFLRQMVQIWLQNVHSYRNIFADMQLSHFYRWLQSTRSLLYESILERTIQEFMRKLL
ncbi:unnamed protein product, partial [Rotaria sordida]